MAITTTTPYSSSVYQQDKEFIKDTVARFVCLMTPKLRTFTVLTSLGSVPG